jgi:serine/threonine protein kinase
MTMRSRPPTCPDENELVLLADGGLAEPRRASIERHLDGCASCTMLVAELAGMAAPERPVPPRYKVIRQLGAGAMGVVWEAEDKHLGRRVALKFVRTCASEPGRSGTEATSRTRERRKRLVREARALAQLRHPNVVNVYDVGESNDELFLALELVIGMDARTWRAAHPRSTDDVLAVWRQAAAGMAAVHRAGLVHRDIKPDNILVADDGRVLVGDFGLATDHGVPGSRHAHDHLTANAPLTATGAIVGTPIYMAYELLLGEPASQKSDQFALCVSIWEALAGERPFQGATLAVIASAMQARPAIPAIASPAHRDIFIALARGLDPSPSRRWPSIDALLVALDARVRRPGRSRVRPALLAVAAASVAAIATVAVLAWRDHASRTPTPAASSVRGAVVHVPAPLVAPALPTPRAAAQPVRPSRAAKPVAPMDAIDHAPTKSAPTPDATSPDLRTLIARARTKLDHGDAQGCLELLARIAHLEADELRAKCTMKYGDCPRGRALLEAAARARGWDKSWIAGTVHEADFTYCPLDAGPRSEWPARARHRIGLAVSALTSCKPVLAFMAKQGMRLPDHEALLEATCHVIDGDCETARAVLRRGMRLHETEPSRVAARDRAADEVFAKSYPACE